MATRLGNLRVKEVSLVDAGANRGALVKLFKGMFGKGAAGLPHPHSGSAFQRLKPKRQPGTTTLTPARKARAMEIDFTKSYAEVDGDYESDILKRQFSSGERKERAENGHAMPDGSFPIDNKSDLDNAIKAVGRAKNPAKAKAHITARAKALGASLPDSWKGGKRGIGQMLKTILGGADDEPEIDEQEIEPGDASEIAEALMEKIDTAIGAIQKSVASILADASVNDKEEMIKKSFSQFHADVKQFIPDGIAVLAEEIFASVAEADLGNSEGDTMLKIAKALGLPDNATEDKIVEAMAKRHTDDQIVVKTLLGLPATATDDEVKKALTEAAELSTAIAKMSQKHQQFMQNGGKMPKGGKKAFGAMEPAERDAHCAANPIDGGDDDEDTEKSRKVKLEKALASLDPGVRKMVEDGQAALADVLKLKDEKLTESITKRASVFELVAPVADIAKTLLAVAKLDPVKGPELVTEIEKLLKTGNERIEKGELFAEKGAMGVQMGAAMDQITTLAKAEQAKDPKLTIEKARTMVRKLHPDLAKKEQDEASARRRAA